MEKHEQYSLILNDVLRHANQLKDARNISVSEALNLLSIIGMDIEHLKDIILND